MTKIVRLLCRAVEAENFALAKELARQAQKPRQPRVPRSRRPAAVQKATKRKTVKERRSALREQAMVRDGGCILRWEGECTSALHMHHIIGRHDERLETVAILCLAAHKQAHDGNVTTLRAIQNWCGDNGYTDAWNALSHRISKIEEARKP